MSRGSEKGHLLDASSHPAGWRILVPGLAQWTWGQGERGMVFFGSFASAIVVGVFTWGTRTGLAMLAVAFLVHAVSAADAIRQGAFPGFGRVVPTASASIGLGLGCYIPLLGLASVLAWPGTRGAIGPEGFLVNRWAYRSTEPKAGDAIWCYPFRAKTPELGNVLAGPGQQVEWSAGGLKVDGKTIDVAPPKSSAPEATLTLFVPRDYVLVGRADGQPPFDTSSGLALLPRERIVGRAWAQFTPFRQRRLLP